MPEATTAHRAATTETEAHAPRAARRPPTRTQQLVTLDTALTVVALAVAEGAQQGVSISVAVVDASMTLVAFGKDDRATPHSVDTSRVKANTAASTRRATGWMDDDLAIPLPLATGGRLTNIRGGVPIVLDGVVVGALGVAGGTPEQDAAVAVAALGRLTDQLALPPC